MCFTAHSRPRISWWMQQESLEMLPYFTLKSLKNEIVEVDSADIFTSLPHVQIGKSRNISAGNIHVMWCHWFIPICSWSFCVSLLKYWAAHCRVCFQVPSNGFPYCTSKCDQCEPWKSSWNNVPAERMLRSQIRQNREIDIFQISILNRWRQTWSLLRGIEAGPHE